MIETGDIVITPGGLVGTVTAIRGRTAFVWMDWESNVNKVEAYKLSALTVAGPEDLRGS